jgi:hypothetical protein
MRVGSLKAPAGNDSVRVSSTRSMGASTTLGGSVRGALDGARATVAEGLARAATEPSGEGDAVVAVPQAPKDSARRATHTDQDRRDIGVTLR